MRFRPEPLVLLLLYLQALASANLVCNEVANASEIIKIDVDAYPGGEYLLAHGGAEGTLFQDVPVACNWQLFLADSKNWAMLVQFEQFDLPESSSTVDDLLTACDKNNVKIYWIDETEKQSEPVLESTICGNGLVSEFLTKEGRSLLIKVSIEDPFQGFKIKFSKVSREVGVKSLAVSCDESSHFLCPEDPQVCLPKSYQCDFITDCPNGGDEATCQGGDDKYQIDSGCGSKRYIEADSGSITSLNYPCNYTNELRCRWYIKTTPGSKILIAFNEIFDIENGKSAGLINDCPYDSLTIFSRIDETYDSMELVGRVCGNSMPKPYIVIANELIVNFETDNFDTTFGFRMHWSVVDDSTVEMFAGTDRLNRLNAKSRRLEDASKKLKLYPGGKACDPSQSSPAKLPDLHGIVTSFKYGPGGKYNAKTLCRWRFEPAIPEGHKFKQFEFHFLDFDVPARPKCERAGVKLKYILSPTKQGIKDTYCNVQRPPTEKAIVMFAPIVEMEFITDVVPGNTGRGFKFEFKVITESTAPPPPPPQPSGQSLSFSQGSGTRPQGMIRQASCGVADYKRPATVVRAQNSESQVRIVGGRPAKPGRWRWPVLLTHMPTEAYCGGSIIYPRWIITAAHCFGAPHEEYHQSKPWKITVGRHSRHDPVAWDSVSPFIEPEIQSIYVHGNYSSKRDNKLFDIALIKLKTKLDFNSKLIMPICLPPREVRTGKQCMVVGWGDTKGTGGEGVLKEAEMPILDADHCKSMNDLYQRLVNPQQMICAGYEQGKIDACQGDSGGPLMCENNGKWYLQGLVSWGKGCAGKKAPGVYTKVYNLLDWINEIISKNSRD